MNDKVEVRVSLMEDDTTAGMLALLNALSILGVARIEEADIEGGANFYLAVPGLAAAEKVVATLEDGDVIARVEMTGGRAP